MQQLPLPLQNSSGSTFENFYPGPNGLLVSMLENMFDLHSEQQIYLWGGAQQGKSHLLQAVCHEASEQGLAAAYFPLRDMGSISPDMLEGLEQLALVAIDDIEVVLGNMDWELALFNLINLSRTTTVRLLFSSGRNPSELELILPDLRSRLTWGPVFNLQSLSDDEKKAALAWRADMRGLELAEPVADYLVAHFPRSLFALFESMDRLDQASLAEQRRLTIPFVKQVLEVSPD